MSFVEFAYNRACHSTTVFSPFKGVYSFNPLTPLDLISLLIDHQLSLNGKKKAEFVKSIHAKIREHIEKKNDLVASKQNN